MGQIYEITPFTLLDYPDELACIVWISGCNFRCLYCHNPDIVLSRGKKEDAELLAFLESRRGKLTGVVFSGGEATFCPSLPDLARAAKAMGYKVKIDTNGSNPSVLRDLVATGSLDYVALDYKAPLGKTASVVGTDRFEAAFVETLDFLISETSAGRLKMEVRTTVSPDFLNETDVALMIGDLDRRGYQGTYWLQHVASVGEHTLGHIAPPSRILDRDNLPVPKTFTLGFRNFPKDA